MTAKQIAVKSYVVKLSGEERERLEMVLMLRTVFHLALRQAEAFASSVLRLLGLDLSAFLTTPHSADVAVSLLHGDRV